jgi:hypothetical protein
MSQSPADRNRNAERRMPPPDATGKEAEYLLSLKDGRIPIRVEMLDGTEFAGIVEYYDREMIKVNRLDGSGPNVVLRKRHVRSIREDGTG